MKHGNGGRLNEGESPVPKTKCNSCRVMRWGLALSLAALALTWWVSR
jgi:hypothetical protein